MRGTGKRQQATGNRKPSERGGFTLLELLIVTGIVLMLSVMFIPLATRMQEQNRISRAATQIQNVVAQMKNRALREGKTVGVRLLQDINQGEIPPGMLIDDEPVPYGPMTNVATTNGPVLHDVDGDKRITFVDLNYQETDALHPSFTYNAGTQDPATGRFYQGYVNQGHSSFGCTHNKITDLNNNGIIDPTDLLGDPGVPYPNQRGGWKTVADEDGSLVADDILAHVQQIEYVEDPGPFADGWIWAQVPGDTSPVLLPEPPPPGFSDPPTWHAAPAFLSSNVLNGVYPFPWNDFGTITRRAQSPSFSFTRSVQPGDHVEIHGSGQLYRVLQVRPANPASNQPDQLVVTPPISNTIRVPTNLLPNYRIIRKPRPVAGETPIVLPENVVIDLSPLDTTTTPYSFPYNQQDKDGVWRNGLSTQGIRDIMFSPDGRVIGQAASNDRIFLWLRDTSPTQEDPDPDPNRPSAPPRPLANGNQALVVIYCHTGATKIFPVDRTLGENPYLYVHQARGGGGL